MPPADVGDSVSVMAPQVENLLPQHVTQYFLKVDVTTSQHEELYAQSFDEVGVLFASMPNFAGKRSGRRAELKPANGASRLQVW